MVESIIVNYALEVTNYNQGQPLVNSFEVSDQGEKCLFKVFGVIVVRSRRRSNMWCLC